MFSVKTGLVTKRIHAPRSWTDPYAHGRERWLAVLNAVMDIRVPQIAGNFLTG